MTRTTIAAYPSVSVLKSRKGLNPGCGKSLPDLTDIIVDHIVASPLTCSPPSNANAIMETDAEDRRGDTALETAVAFASATRDGSPPCKAETLLPLATPESPGSAAVLRIPTPSNFNNASMGELFATASTKATRGYGPPSLPAAAAIRSNITNVVLPRKSGTARNRQMPTMFTQRNVSMQINALKGFPCKPIMFQRSSSASKGSSSSPFL
jgi:hypothetical protein